MTADPTLDFRNPACKSHLLDVMQREADAMHALAAVPGYWCVATACEGWEVRDMVGHLVDALESSLTGFAAARGATAAPAAVGVEGMAKATDEAARRFRNVPRDVLLTRFRASFAQLVDELKALSESEWSSLMVADKYLGPLPAMVVAVGLLGGFAVHGWDVRQGLGGAHTIAGDAADLLVPFVFLLWSATADTRAVGAPYAVGVRTTGPNGGDRRIDVTRDGLRVTSGLGAVRGCASTFECDPATLVLTAYGRVNAGTVRGDVATAMRFRSLFRPI